MGSVTDLFCLLCGVAIGIALFYAAMDGWLTAPFRSCAQVVRVLYHAAQAVFLLERQKIRIDQLFAEAASEMDALSKQSGGTDRHAVVPWLPTIPPPSGSVRPGGTQEQDPRDLHRAHR